jgi:hypothetical protein
MDMNEAMRAGMLEATRLIRAGELLKATATIQRTLRGIVAPDAAADSQGPTTDAPIEGTFRVIDADSLPTPAGADVRPGCAHRPSIRLRAPQRPHRWGYSEPATRPAPAPERARDGVPGGATTKTYGGRVTRFPISPPSHTLASAATSPRSGSNSLTSPATRVETSPSSARTSRQASQICPPPQG